MDAISDYLKIPIEDFPRSSCLRVEVLPDPASLFAHFARSLADEIQANNAAEHPTRLILPVGPIGQYPRLVELCNQERIDWRHTHTFNMDEYCDWQGRWIPADHPLSFRRLMRQEVFERLDPNLRIPPEQTHFPDPLHLDQISKDIQAVGGIDTCYGGIGYHGHIAFNEPPISRWHQVSLEEFRQSKTRIIPLADDSIVMNSSRNTGGNPRNFPPMGVTLGMADILAAKRIRIYCAGGIWQRHAVRMALFGEPTVDYPATLLQNHPDCILYVDQTTAQPAEVSL